jgi:predicted nucleotidyltransferase
MTREEVLAIIEAHRDDLRRLGVASISIFGSVVRDEAGPESDVDVLVELTRPMGYFAFLDIQAYLERVLGRRVDLGTTDSLRPAARARVLDEAVRVA